MDTIFLTYANSSVNTLETLSREDEQVYGILVNRYLKGHYIVHRSSNASTTSMIRDLSKFEDNIAVFMYSGHAGRDTLELTDSAANANGVASYLKKSVQNGKLNLVILNGCSTNGQVQKLLAIGVPAVVATSAPISDKSATEFSINFFEGLVEKNLSLKQAFDAAIKAVLLINQQQLKDSDIVRGVFPREEEKESQPLWGLFVQNESTLDSFPIPAGKQTTLSDFAPNQHLTESLFNTLLLAGNLEVKSLADRENQGDFISLNKKNKAIVDILPFPIGTHLRRLIIPTESETEGWDKIGIRRLEQIGMVYHTSLKFLSFLMIAQLWEFKQDGILKSLPDDLTKKIRQYFYLSTEQRLLFDHFGFVQLIRDFYEKQGVDKMTYFISELEELRQVSSVGHPFADACAYLGNLHRQVSNKSIQNESIPNLCEEGEKQLCNFFEHLGFLHKYILASVDNIEVRQYRHQRTPDFGHKICKLMRASGTRETIVCVLPKPMDNKGVMLLKGKMVFNRDKRQFEGEVIDFLNLSPFMIDINVLEQKADLYNLFFFDDFVKENKVSHFRKISKSLNENEYIKIQANNIYTLFFEQLQAFRTDVLCEI